MFKKIIIYIKIELSLWLFWLINNIPGLTGTFCRRLLVKNKGKGLMIWNNVNIEYYSNLVVGENVSINRGSILNCAGGILIGNNVLIGPRVLIYSQNHLYKNRSVLVCKQGYEKKR